MIGDIKFEKLQPFPEENFFMFRRNGNIIGYVNFFKERGWYFYFGNVFSKPFSTKDEATEGLITYVATHDFDLFAKKTGTYNNEEFTKGR